MNYIKFLSVGLIIVCVFTVSGCAQKQTTASAPQATSNAENPKMASAQKIEENKEDQNNIKDWTVVKRPFGEYKIPKGFNRVITPLEPKQAIYSVSDVSTDVAFSNITVERFDMDENTMDIASLQNEAKVNAQSNAAAGLNVEEITTNNKYPALKCSYELEKEEPQTIKEYYILGNSQYVKISSDKINDSIVPDVNVAVEQVADSFRWLDNASVNSTEYTCVQTSFAEFFIPSQWERNEQVSKDDMPVYAPKGKDLTQPCSNVSVLIFDMPFTREEYVAFIADISKQLGSQGVAKDTVFDMVDSEKHFAFSLSYDLNAPKEFEATQTQYYVMLDNKAVQITATRIKDDVTPDVHDVALQMIETMQFPMNQSNARWQVPAHSTYAEQSSNARFLSTARH